MKGSLRPIAALVAALAMATCHVACGGSDDPAGSTTAGEGIVSSRSAAFEKYSGRGRLKLHLAEFGVEARGADRTAAEATIVGYLQASGRGEWSRACGYVAAGLRSQIDEIARQSKDGPRPACGEILHALAKAPRVEGGRSAIHAPEGIASLRIKEDPGGGFALFHGSDGGDYWIGVKREGGEWKVLSAVPQAFG